MEISYIFPVTVNILTGGVSQTGFGMPAVYGFVPTAVIPPSQRSLTLSAATAHTDLITAGLAGDDPVVLAVDAIIAQRPCPPLIKVLRGASSFTFSSRVTCVATPATDRIQMSIIAENPAVAGSILSESVDIAGTGGANGNAAALKVALDATAVGVAGTVVFTNTGAPSAVVDITTNPATNRCAWIDDLYNLTLIDNQADRGISNDLDAIVLVDPDWYCLLLADAFGEIEIEAAAGWVQGKTRILCAATQESEVVDAGTGVGLDMSNLDRDQTSLLYSAHSMHQYPACAMASRFLPEKVGSVVWAHKSLTGVSASSLTTAQSSNAHNATTFAPWVNTYEGVTLEGRTVVAGNLFGGWSSANETTSIETIRTVHEAVVRVQERLLSGFRSSRKVPMDDSGISAVRGWILGVMQEREGLGFAKGTSFCNVPLASSLTPAEIQAQTLPDVSFGATLLPGMIKCTIAATFVYA